MNLSTVHSLLTFKFIAKMEIRMLCFFLTSFNLFVLFDVFNSKNVQGKVDKILVSLFKWKKVTFVT